MKATCRRLKLDIINKAKLFNLDPYKNEFQPKDLKLRASDYGAFADHCKIKETKSAQWCNCGLLKRKNRKYILMK